MFWKLTPAAFLPVFAAIAWQTPKFDELAAQAAAARDADRPQEAVALYRQALELKPDWAEGWWFAGTISYDSDRYAAGRDAFRQFVKLQGRAAPGWSFLGLCEFETGEYAAALADIERGLSLAAGLQPDLEKVLRFHEGMLLTRSGMFPQALRKYAWFVERSNRTPDLLAAVGLAALHRAILPKDLPGEQRELAMAAGTAASFWIAGQPDEARKRARELMERFPDAAGVHYLYGSFLAASDPAAALAQWQRELEINPGDSEDRAMVAFSHIRDGDFAGAVPIAKKAAEDGPSSAFANFVYGRRFRKPELRKRPLRDCRRRFRSSRRTSSSMRRSPPHIPGPDEPPRRMASG